MSDPLNTLGFVSWGLLGSAEGGGEGPGGTVYVLDLAVNMVMDDVDLLMTMDDVQTFAELDDVQFTVMLEDE